jgi:hypothetical protein
MLLFLLNFILLQSALFCIQISLIEFIILHHFYLSCIYRFKSAGSTNQPEPISIEFPMSRGSNPLVATKAKGKKLGK